MSVHYKFKSALSFDTITFDGLHISIKDLKKAILQQKQIGKASDFDLQITNAQSNEVYEDESTLVPKNSSLIVVRVPLTTQQKKSSEKSDVLPALGKGAQDGLDPAVNKLAKTVDLTNVDASETDKIQAAITQSTLEYDPSNYLRIKGSNQVGELPANYRCYKCLQPGHWIRDCKLNSQPDSSVDIKKSTGIPRSFMVPVEGPEVPGAMMTPTGHFAVPSIEHEARKEPLKKLKEPVVVEKPIIPNDLMCGVCKDLLTDAVLIPCCGNSFCDECIRNVLLESEDHQCPDCREKDVSPDTLIPNRFLRNSVNSFRNKTGYVKVIPVKTASALPEKPPSPKLEAAPEKLKVKDSHLEDGELEIVEESSSTQGQPSGSIPSLTNPPPIADPTILPTNFEQGSNTVENLLPIPNLAVNSRSQPNYISHKGDETSHYIKKEKLYNNRHERSGTPTIDENRYRIESLGGMQPRIPPPMQQPMLYTHGYMYHQRPPQYIPPRPDMTPYPPGVDDPNMIRMPYGHRLPYNHRPRAPYSMSHNGNNQPGMLTNTLELFTKIINDKEKRRNRIKRRSRSITRSYSRSPSPKRYRGRSRSLRSRTRTRSRTPRSRTRSRSRSAYIRKRSRSRSFSMSRSPYSERSGNRSLSRERHFSPSRRRDYRHSPNYRASPHRYYSKKYKEEHASHSLKVPERRSRHASKQDYYPPDYPRRTDRYESRYKERERDHEKDRERDKDRGHHRKYDELDAREIAKQAGLDLRAKVADDWEKTRDRELELRKKEAQQQLYSQEKSRKDQSQVEAIESTSREELRPPGVADEDRSRVLVSVHCDEVKETSKSPEKEKKKEKRKKKKEEVDRKKKKKKKDKKDEDGEDTSKNLYEDEVKLDQEIIQKYTETPKEEKDVVLAPLPELSKWEKDEETAPSEENKKPNEESKVTSEVIKRAENAIFKKIHIKPIDAKKPERRVKLAEKEEKEEKPEKKEKDRRKNDKEERAPRSVALPVEKDRKNVPQRISAKERLGAKVDDKVVIKHEIRERREIKVLEKKPKEKIEIKKLSEENFEPDYEKEEEVKDEPKKRSLSPETEPEAKKLKEDKAKSSSPDSSLSSDDSEKHHKKRKKAKKHKKRRKKKKHGSSSDSDSSTSSSDSESEKKKRRHKHKSHKKSKKRKKSKK